MCTINISDVKVKFFFYKALAKIWHDVCDLSIPFSCYRKCHVFARKSPYTYGCVEFHLKCHFSTLIKIWRMSIVQRVFSACLCEFRILFFIFPSTLWNENTFFIQLWWWLPLPVPNSNGLFSLRFVCYVDCIYKERIFCVFFWQGVKDRIWLKEFQIDSTSKNGDEFAMECLSLRSKEIVIILFCRCTLKCNTTFGWVRRICNEHILIHMSCACQHVAATTLFIYGR